MATTHKLPSLDHVVEEDAEGPDGEGAALVPGATDPLGRGVHAGAWNKKEKNNKNNNKIKLIGSKMRIKLQFS